MRETHRVSISSTQDFTLLTSTLNNYFYPIKHLQFSGPLYCKRIRRIRIRTQILWICVRWINFTPPWPTPSVTHPTIDGYHQTLTHFFSKLLTLVKPLKKPTCWNLIWQNWCFYLVTKAKESVWLKCATYGCRPWR